MAFRQRVPTIRPTFSVRRVYETLQPRSETQELPEAFLLRVYLPGFPRGSVKITYEAISRTVRITGERQLQGTRWHKIDQAYPIPDYCEAEALQGKFETPVLTVTMPKKKAISQDAPKQQEVETPKGKGLVAEPNPDEKSQEITPPEQPTTTTKLEEAIEEKKSVTPPSLDSREQKKASLEEITSQIVSELIKDQKGQEGGVERVGSPQKGEKELEPKPTPPTRVTTMQTYAKPQNGQQEFEPRAAPTMVTKVKTAERPQKAQEEFEAKPTPTMLTKVKTSERPQKGQEEFEAKPTPTRTTTMQTNEMPQKGLEDFEPKPTPTMLTKVKTSEKPQMGQEESNVEPKSKTDDEQLQRGQDELEPKPAITNNVTRKSTVKEQLEEKKTEETSAEDSKKEDKNETSESTKSLKYKEQGDFEEKETKVEKLLTKEAEPSAQKKKKEKRKRKSEKKAVESGASVSQVFTKLAQGMLNEEERKLAANIGASILIIAALGYYVSNKFSS
ncbi:hypothetical protein VNO78_07325 [Psophocarpus tetragonolobus]|uniref:SHSP domain-containing protein n=1 Tax=Psophocarpus tetragonolobus TaxID=3891 RepID=A0AAN9T2Y3_PSOTE